MRINGHRDTGGRPAPDQSVLRRGDGHGALRRAAARAFPGGARRRGLRGADGAARADGPERLPGRSCATRTMPRTPSRRPSWSWSRRPAQSGAADDLGGLAAPGRAIASRSRPMPPRPGGAVHERQAGQMAAATSIERSRQPRMSCCRRCTRRSPGCPRSIRLAVVLCDLQGHDPGTRPPGSCDWSETDAPTPAGRGARAAQGADWPAAAWHPSGAVLAAVLLREARAAVPPAWREATVRAALDRPQSHRHRRGRLGGGAVT